MERKPGRFATTSPRYPAMPSVFCKSAEETGPSRMNCIGFWMSTLNEDRTRVRKDRAPEKFAVLRHITIKLFKQEKTAKGGIYAKQLQAAWNQDYLLQILAAGN